MKFAIYYGPATDAFPEGYDLVVLEPSAWGETPHLCGTTFLAYCSVLEVPVMGGPPPPNVLRMDGNPYRNLAWGNWVLDPRHPLTRERLIDTAAELRSAGWDGLFLDTIDVADPNLVPATAELVAAAAEAWPGGALVQNRGLGLLLPLTAPYLTAVCWEDFPAPQLTAGDPGATNLARRLQVWSSKRGLRVLALNERVSRNVAEAWGFPWYGAPGAYTALPPPPSPSTLARRSPP